MCTTRDEIRSIVHEEMYAAYNGVAQTISGLGREVKELADRFEKHDEKEKEYQIKVEEHLAQKQLSKEQLETLIMIVNDRTEEEVLKKSAKKIKDIVIGLATFLTAVGTITIILFEAVKRLIK